MKDYDADERIRHAIAFFKKSMKPEAENLKWRIMRLVIGIYGEKGITPAAAAKQVRTKDLEVYAAMTGFDLDGTIAEGVKEVLSAYENPTKSKEIG